MRLVHDAEEQRITDLGRVNLRLEKLEAGSEKMLAHIDAEEHRRVHAEEARKKRNRRIKWLAVTIGLPVLVAIAGSGAAAWTQILVQSRAQARAVATQTVQSAAPSTEGAYGQGFKDGSKAVVDEQLARLQSNPAPIQRSPDSVAPRSRQR